MYNVPAAHQWYAYVLCNTVAGCMYSIMLLACIHIIMYMFELAHAVASGHSFVRSMLVYFKLNRPSVYSSAALSAVCNLDFAVGDDALN